MWPVSAQFLAALAAPHRLTTTATVTVPGGSPLTLNVESGSISADATSRIRRTCSLSVEGDSSVYLACATPGAIFAITHGLVMGNTTETVPVFYGELAGDSEQQFGDGTIGLQLADHGNWLSRTRFLTPYTPAAATPRPTVITNVVQAARPGTVVVNSSTDSGTVAASALWLEDGPLDVVSDLSTDGGLESYFGPDGTFNIRALQTITTPPVWSIQGGKHGTLKQASRKRLSDRLYNTVVVRPSALDGSQTWPQQVAQVDDLTNPRHPLYIGVVPYFWDSPTALTAAAAMNAAQKILARVLGTTESLSLEAISNPALDVNDVIRVTTPQINTQVALSFQHYIDSLSIDVVSGAMTLATRSQLVTDA